MRNLSPHKKNIINICLIVLAFVFIAVAFGSWFINGIIVNAIDTSGVVISWSIGSFFKILNRPHGFVKTNTVWVLWLLLFVLLSTTITAIVNVCLYRYRNLNKKTSLIIDIICSALLIAYGIIMLFIPLIVIVTDLSTSATLDVGGILTGILSILSGNCIWVASFFFSNKNEEKQTNNKTAIVQVSDTTHQ